MGGGGCVSGYIFLIYLLESVTEFNIEWSGVWEWSCFILYTTKRRVRDGEVGVEVIFKEALIC